MKKHRLLFLISALKNCGPINVVHGIIKGLDRDKFDVFILSLSKGPKDDSVQRFSELKIQINILDNSRIRGYFSNKLRVQQFINDQKINLVHSHGIRADQINSTLQNVQRCTTVHNFPDEDYRYRYGKFIGSILASKHKSVIKNIPCRICCSQSLAKRFQHKNKINMEFVRNGIDLKRFSSVKDSSEKNRLRKQLNLPVDTKIFVVCGGVSYLKNSMLILDAFNRNPFEDTMLLFLGDGELLDKLSSENSNPSIRFQGKTDRVSDFLKASDFYISASSTEGMPNSVLEAISSETPVVLSNIPAHREIVGENYSYLFDPINQQELRQKLKEILENDNQVISKKLKHRVKANFSIESMSDSYQQLYLKALNTNKITDI